MASKKPRRPLNDAWKDSGVDESIHILPRINTSLPVSDCIAVKDSFTNGPCDVDPAQQRLKRETYWQTARQLFWNEPSRKAQKRRSKQSGSAFQPIVWASRNGSSRKIGGADEVSLALANVSESRPVVIWATRHWSDRLALWWSLESIHRMQLDISRFTVATVRSPWASRDLRQADPFPIACAPAADLRTAFDQRVPLTAQFLESASSLWRKFADASPLAFDQERRNGCATFPELRSAAETYGWLYPRSRAGGISVRLSILDEAFLEGFLVDEWLTPWEVLWISQRAQAVLDKHSHRDSSAPNSGTCEDPPRQENVGDRTGSNESLLCRLVDERVASDKQEMIMPIIEIIGDMLFAVRLFQWATHIPMGHASIRWLVARKPS